VLMLMARLASIQRVPISRRCAASVATHGT
jgi:hypothetical protein